MAKFIGSSMTTDNWGEDFFVSKLVESFDDTYVVYRNRPIYGAQFDIALLAPKIGIIIFEVKAWKADTIIKVKNGDSIVIRSITDTGIAEEVEENPTSQVRGYVYKMRSKIRQKTGKTPLVYGMVCFPNLTKLDYDSKGIEPVCEYEETILKEDLSSPNALLKKLNLCLNNHKNEAKYKDFFSDDIMFRVRQIFETDLKIEDQTIENTDLVEGATIPETSPYSILAYLPHDQSSVEHIKELAQAYKYGTKLFLIVSNIQELYCIRDEINAVIKQKGLYAKGLDLELDLLGEQIAAPISNDSSYMVFNCSAFLVNTTNPEWPYMTAVDGVILSETMMSILEFASENSSFNKEQFMVEHCDLKRNTIVRAGAGTGKTYTMISRIAFLCHMQNCSMKEMANRIVMITFTDEAANQMENKIKKHFNNYYLLTRSTECLAFINLIEGMQISTIHSYAKKIISLLGIEYGYGTTVSVSSSDYKLKQIIAETVDEYIVGMQKKQGQVFVKKLGMPIYQINRNIYNMITKLHNQSVDITELNDASFGKPVLEDGKELHRLIATIIPIIESKSTAFFRKENRVHLSNMMSVLDQCLSNEENRNRLFRMQTGRPQFMFVDEFQDTDDVQIESLVRIADLLQYKLFVVGDVKQCIYRFRGAKENAFEKLDYKNNINWAVFSLVKNYRTDSTLLDIFHHSFSQMGERYPGGEQLLIYDSQPNSESGRLIGTRSINASIPSSSFYRKIQIAEESNRLQALFTEIEWQQKIIRDMQNTRSLSAKEKEIAILVRENWQAEIIKKEGKSRNIDIVTNTGGDLYMSEPALDMLTLVNALLHYDESDYLYALVSSNFIGGGISKSQLYQIRDNEKRSGWKKGKSLDTTQTKELWGRINRELSRADDKSWRDWMNIVKSLRTMPVLQVLRKMYQILRPWVNYGQESKWRQDHYRLNVELLFEELIQSVNADSVSINSLVDVLTANIISQKNVDSREPSKNVKQECVVRCITIHKAKGLEYGVVILPYCSFSIDRMKRTDMNVSVYSEGDIHIGYQMKIENDQANVVFQNDFFDEVLEKNERMREEARILYVAMTRAIRSFSWIALDNKNGNNWQNLIWEEL